MTTAATQENRNTKKANAEVFSSTTYRQQIYRDHETHEADVLMQLRSNLAQLEDLHERLRFAMSEITSLIRK